MKKGSYDIFGNWQDISNIVRAMNPNKYIYRAVKNKIFSVMFSKFQTDNGEMIHLWIRRHNQNEISWQEKQNIKNALVSGTRCGIELFPAEKDVRSDEYNRYHVYVFPEGFEPTFGLHTKENFQ